jgi:hypothetical protein
MGSGPIADALANRELEEAADPVEASVNPRDLG